MATTKKFSDWVGTELPSAQPLTGSERAVVIQDDVPRGATLATIEAFSVYADDTDSTPVVIGVEADDNLNPTNWQNARTFVTPIAPNGRYEVEASVWWTGDRDDRAAYIRLGVDGAYAPFIRQTPTMGTDVVETQLRAVGIFAVPNQAHVATIDVVSESGGGAAMNITVAHSVLSFERKGS